jgi:phage terminase large subunit-like protein
MGLRGPKTAASKAATPISTTWEGIPPWEKEGLSRAEKVITFIETLPITSGAHAGRRFILRSWQKKIINALYKTNKAGKRIVRQGLITVARKNGKSTLCAALALVHLLGPESESRGQVLSAACDREQAAIIFRELEAIVYRVPEFEARCHVQSFHKRISDMVTGSIYQALTADSRKSHGLSPSFVIADELSQWANRDLFDGLITGTGARSEPLMITISTQSADNLSIMSELVDYSEKIGDGTLPKDKTFSGHIFTVPIDADPWDEKNWKLANPALGDFRSLEEMRNFADQAKKIPAKEAVFRNLYLNQRVDPSGRWISSEAFDACIGNLPDLSGRECYGGLDLSSTQDLSALSLAFVPKTEDEPYYCLSFPWCPKEAIKTRSVRDRVDYSLWAKQGYLEATPGAVVDYSYILKRIDELAVKYDLKGVLFDRWGASKIIQDLSDRGLQVIECGQGFASLSPPSKELEKLILEKKIMFPENPALRWCFGNVIVESDAAGNVKPSKKRSREKIDMVVATVMALDGALRNTKKSVMPSISWL